MTMFTRTLVRTVAAGAIGAVLATSAFAQSAREIRGASPYEEVANEPAARLTVDPPFPGPLAQGIFQAQYRSRMCASCRCLGLALSPRRHASGICTSPSMTCPGGGLTRATTTPST